MECPTIIHQNKELERVKLGHNQPNKYFEFFLKKTLQIFIFNKYQKYC